MPEADSENEGNVFSFENTKLVAKYVFLPYIPNSDKKTMLFGITWNINLLVFQFYSGS